jgi:TPR repeat protein
LSFKKAIEGHNQNNPNSTYQLALWSKNKLLHSEAFNTNELFLKSAIRGHTQAQFEVGQSLIFGKGCKVNKLKGLAWLNRAASNGELDAKELLANVLMSNNDIGSQQQAIEYYKSIKDTNSLTKINYAKLLINSSHKEISNPEKALNIIENIPYNLFRDRITLDEVKASAYFKLGKLRKAISYQEDALSHANHYAADTTDAEETLRKYKAEESST